MQVSFSPSFVLLISLPLFGLKTLCPFSRKFFYMGQESGCPFFVPSFFPFLDDPPCVRKLSNPSTFPSDTAALAFFSDDASLQRFVALLTNLSRRYCFRHLPTEFYIPALMRCNPPYLCPDPFKPFRTHCSRFILPLPPRRRGIFLIL